MGGKWRGNGEAEGRMMDGDNLGQMQTATRRKGDPLVNMFKAIAACDRREALVAMAGILDRESIESPAICSFYSHREDAEWWAEIAPPHQVQAYVWAGLKQLRHEAMGRDMRARMIVALWNGMAPEDRVKFLAFAKGQQDA
jgi:hypothetical protein